MRRWVRTATEADLQVLRDLYRDHHLQPVADKFFLEKIKREEIMIALEDQNMRGYVILDKTSILELPYIQEPIMYKNEEHEGFDTKLMNTVEAYLKNLGYRKVITSCAVSNGRAIMRNKNNGYEEAGKLQGLRRDNNEEMIMIKTLEREE